MSYIFYLYFKYWNIIIKFVFSFNFLLVYIQTIELEFVKRVDIARRVFISATWSQPLSLGHLPSCLLFS